MLNTIKLRRPLTGLLLLALAGCVTITPFDPDKEPPPAAKLYPIESTEGTATGEVVKVKAEGEGMPEAEEEVKEQVKKQIPEQLLPTGILEVGSPKAPITILQFTEHNCFYCREFEQEYTDKLLKDFISQGKAKLHIQILPLKKYAGSGQGAAALICAGQQGKGWEMHRALFRGQLSVDSPKKIAEELELDTAKFNECLQTGQVHQYLAEQAAIAQSFNVTLVPTFFFNGEKQVGLPLYPDLRGRLNKMLEE